MKTIFTSVFLFFTISIVTAQNATYQKPYTLPVASPVLKSKAVKHSAGSNSRSTGSCDTVFIDYTTYNEQFANNMGLNFNGSVGSGQLYGAALTSFVDTFHQGEFRYVEAVFDSLVYVDASGLFHYYPLAKSTVSLDSFSFYLSLNGNPAKMRNDSLVFSIYSITDITFSPVPVKTVVLRDTSDLSVYNVGSSSFRLGTVPVGYQFNKGQGFAIKMEYLGKDSSTHCHFAYSFADSCGTINIPGTGTIKSPAYLSPIAVLTPTGYIPVSNFGIIYKNPGNNLPVVQDENNFWSYNIIELPTNCSSVFYQNMDIFPMLTICTDYATKITPEKARACPGSTVNLTSAVFGTKSTNVNYDWSVFGNGTLTSNNTDANSVVLGNSGNVTVSLSVNDGFNITTDSVVITNAGINISVTNTPQPVSIPCSGLSPVTIISTTTGAPISQQGKTYKWSSGATTSTIQAKFAGTYTVTVTNNTYCTAAASVEVVYDNGTSNNVNFNNPSNLPPLPVNTVCLGRDVYFTNTSTKFAVPWVAHWDFVGDGKNIYDITNGASTATNIYLSVGVVHPILRMDSAGCIFTSPTKTLTVTIAVCESIFEARTDELITVKAYPNPFSNLTNIVVEGLKEKYDFELLDITGRLGKRIASIDTDRFVVNRDNLSTGIYFYRIVTSSGKAAYGKLVVE